MITFKKHVSKIQLNHISASNYLLAQHEKSCKLSLYMYMCNIQKAFLSQSHVMLQELLRNDLFNHTPDFWKSGLDWMMEKHLQYLLTLHVDRLIKKFEEPFVCFFLCICINFFIHMKVFFN